MASSEQTTEKTTEKPVKKTKRARLGRGLGALIDQGGGSSVSIDLESKHNPNAVHNTNERSAADAAGELVPDADASMPGSGERVLELALDAVVPNPHQPRRVFDEQALRALSDSIVRHGLMQPIVVRRRGEGYELVAGERRWRAAKLAELTTIRAVVSEADDERSAELALIENIQRADLNPIERASGLAQLMERFGMTQGELAERMGMSRPAVANLVRLLELEEELRALVAEGQLPVGHAKVLLSCNDPQRRLELARACIDRGWTVRALEREVGQAKQGPDNITNEPNKDRTLHDERVRSVVRDMERQLSEQLGTRVTLQTNTKGTRGRISIEFYDLDQFDGLLTRLGVRPEEQLGG